MCMQSYFNRLGSVFIAISLSSFVTCNIGSKHIFFILNRTSYIKLVRVGSIVTTCQFLPSLTIFPLLTDQTHHRSYVDAESPSQLEGVN